MAARAEGAPGIDDDIDQAVLRIPPGGTYADPARHLDRPVEARRALEPRRAARRSQTPPSPGRVPPPVHSARARAGSPSRAPRTRARSAPRDGSSPSRGLLRIECLGDALGGLPLLRVEAGRHDQFEDHVLIATAPPMQRRQATTAQQPD